MFKDNDGFGYIPDSMLDRYAEYQEELKDLKNKLDSSRKKEVKKQKDLERYNARSHQLLKKIVELQNIIYNIESYQKPKAIFEGRIHKEDLKKEREEAMNHKKFLEDLALHGIRIKKYYREDGFIKTNSLENKDVFKYPDKKKNEVPEPKYQYQDWPLNLYTLDIMSSEKQTFILKMPQKFYGYTFTKNCPKVTAITVFLEIIYNKIVSRIILHEEKLSSSEGWYIDKIDYSFIDFPRFGTDRETIELIVKNPRIIVRTSKIQSEKEFMLESCSIVFSLDFFSHILDKFGSEFEKRDEEKTDEEEHEDMKKYIHDYILMGMNWFEGEHDQFNIRVIK